MPIRQGLTTAIGGFILLTTSVIAVGFAQVGQGQNSVGYAPEVVPDENLQPREDLEPPDHAPHAGAYLRID